jgi:hypothetical protein
MAKKSEISRSSSPGISIINPQERSPTQVMTFTYKPTSTLNPQDTTTPQAPSSSTSNGNESNIRFEQISPDQDPFSSVQESEDDSSAEFRIFEFEDIEEFGLLGGMNSLENSEQNQIF